MSASAPDDSLAGVLASVASAAAARFRGRNLMIRTRGTVHAVMWAPWMGGWELPAPACHVGVFGWVVDDLHPTADPVTCKLCLRGNGGAGARAGAQQLALDLDTADPGAEPVTPPTSSSG